MFKKLTDEAAEATTVAIRNKGINDTTLITFEEQILPYIHALEAKVQHLETEQQATFGRVLDLPFEMPKRPSLKIKPSETFDTIVPNLMKKNSTPWKTLQDQINGMYRDVRELEQQHKNMTETILNAAMLERNLVGRVKGLLPVLSTAAERFRITIPANMRMPTPDSEKENRAGNTADAPINIDETRPIFQPISWSNVSAGRSWPMPGDQSIDPALGSMNNNFSDYSDDGV